MDAARRQRIALQELVMDAKMTDVNRLYSGKRMWSYLKRHFGCSEAVLIAMRATLRLAGDAFWPYNDERLARRFVLRKHFGMVEEFCYELKEQEARAMFSSRRLMLRYLRKIYDSSRILDIAIAEAARRGRRYKTLKVRSLPE